MSKLLKKSIALTMAIITILMLVTSVNAIVVKYQSTNTEFDTTNTVALYTQVWGDSFSYDENYISVSNVNASYSYIGSANGGIIILPDFLINIELIAVGDDAYEYWAIRDPDIDELVKFDTNYTFEYSWAIDLIRGIATLYCANDSYYVYNRVTKMV